MEKYSNTIAEMREEIKHSRKLSKIYTLLSSFFIIGGPIAGTAITYSYNNENYLLMIAGACGGFALGLLAGSPFIKMAIGYDEIRDEYINKISELEKKLDE